MGHFTVAFCAGPDIKSGDNQLMMQGVNQSSKL